jgi:hypothetical protein
MWLCRDPLTPLECGNRQVGTTTFQQAHRGGEADALVLAERVPPGPELVGVFDLPCHTGYIFLIRNIIDGNSKMLLRRWSAIDDETICVRNKQLSY